MKVIQDAMELSDFVERFSGGFLDDKRLTKIYKKQHFANQDVGKIHTLIMVNIRESTLMVKRVFCIELCFISNIIYRSKIY